VKTKSTAKKWATRTHHSRTKVLYVIVVIVALGNGTKRMNDEGKKEEKNHHRTMF
jgi:hypothetical protein